jgi:hypothetical protein
MTGDMKIENFPYNDKLNLLIFLGPILTGISIFIVLSTLLIPLRINIPISIVMSFLTFWLTKYYFSNNYHKKVDLIEKTQVNSISSNYILFDKSFSKFLFIIIYSIFLAITFFTSYNPNLFTPWSEFTLLDAIKLTSAIGLSFFMPGYAIINLISRNNELEKILKCFLAYFISVLITGLSAYITASLGFAVLDNKNFILLIYLTILILYSTVNYKKIFNNNVSNITNQRKLTDVIFSLRKNSAVLIVFLSLFSIQIISTYYLFNGTIIGDQWFHHGRSIMFTTGAFKDIYSTGSDYYPPLLSSLLSEFFVLSGVPSVNAYVALNFLNMMPVLIFYFFFTKWVPDRMKKAALLATTLFMLSSGYGWTYVLQLVSSNSLTSQTAVLEIFRISSLKSVDVAAPNNFLNTPQPWVLSSLVIISLPAGFLLLSLLKINISDKLKYLTLILIVSIVGITSHDEFYLFILVGSVLPLIYQLNKSHIIFIALLSSITLVLLMDVLLPVNYFTVTAISGIPLIALCFGFVLTMWGLYASRLLHVLGKRRFLSPKSRFAFNKRTRFVIVSVIVSIILYLYFFTFIVWNHLSVEEVMLQTDNYGQRDIPWYLFPMKFGLVGFLGLLYILSYLYKKFEREIFIFGIIALFAFLAAPYYDEHRLGKYIMVGLIGFSSLLVYRIICYFQTLRINVIITGIALGLVVTSSGLSLLMLIGFTDLLLINPEYRLIPGENNRFFPTPSEMNFFTTLKNKIINLKTDNVALLNKDYDNGLLSEKLMGFVGIPFEKIYHNTLILNASSLTGLFQFLQSDDIKYIIVSKGDFTNSLKNIHPARFALESFPKIYEDDNFVVLKVPQLAGPNPNPDLALVYERVDNLPSPPLYTNLQYDNGSFGLNEGKNVQFKKDGGVILFNNESNPITIWSENLAGKKINNIETDFRIDQENRLKNNSEIDWKDDSSLHQQAILTKYLNNNVGLKWKDKNSEYSLLLTTAGLELFTKKINETSEPYILRNQEVLKEPLKLYNVKILFLKNETLVLVNNLPRFQIARSSDNNSINNISNIGVTSNGNNVEFLPIRVAQISDLDNLYYNNTKNFYYILSSLALRNTSYGVYLEPDFSAISKTIILPFDPTDMNNDRFNTYLEYVRKGGTVIVFNSGNATDGIFSKFLSINLTDEFNEFSKIIYPENNHNNSINVPGKVRGIKFPHEEQLKIVSFYSNKFNKTIVPFGIEKTFPSGGKIVFINSAGFFDSIKSHKNDILMLANVTNLMNVKSNTNLNLSKYSLSLFKPENQYGNTNKFIGLMELEGKIKINSRSILPYNQWNELHNLTLKVDKLKLSNKIENLTFDNVTIKNLKFYGGYEGEINSTGSFSLPSSNSFYDYIDLHMPREFSLKIKITPKEYGAAKITLINQSKLETFNFTDNVEIYIQKRSNELSNSSLSFLIKNPEIKLIGKANIDSPNFSEVPLSGSRFLKINGTISTILDHVDDHYEKSDKTIGARYITYLNGLNITGSTNPQIDKLLIMGDISYRAKNHHIGIPLQEIFSSTQNITLIISVFVICFFVSRLIWSRLIFRL